MMLNLTRTIKFYIINVSDMKTNKRKSIESYMLSQGVKLRGHHNNDGRVMIKSGKVKDSIIKLAGKLGVNYG